MAIVFTGDEFADGGTVIAKSLKEYNVKASFFFTGRFYRNPAFKNIIQQLQRDGHYLGPHSDAHLLYCDWTKRDSLLITKQQFEQDLIKNIATMKSIGIDFANDGNRYFIPPYEWWNDSIAAWCNQRNIHLFCFSSGTGSNADYTTPDMKNYKNSDEIYQSIIQFEKEKPAGLNGFILLLHVGTDPKRKDKLYQRLPGLLQYLQQRHYQITTIDRLLGTH